MRWIDRWDEEGVARALAEGDVDRRDETGASVLWHACYFGQTDWVKRLLDAGARVDGHDPRRIDRAAGSGHVVTIWRAVPTPGYAAPVGPSTLLHAAVARSPSRDLVALLLDRGLAVDARDNFGATPLHIAAFAKQPTICDVLIDHGADPNAVDCAGFAPLDHAWHAEAVVRCLLARGADPNGGPHIAWDGSSHEWSPVANAAFGGRADILRLLLNAGADLTRHREALPLAAKSGHVNEVLLLMKAGAPLDGTTFWRGKDRGPLASAAMYASLACVKRLLPLCRAELDTALSTAVELARDDLPTPPNDRTADRQELVSWLIEQGANPSAAIVAAAGIENESYARMLLDRGAQVNVLSDTGQTPLVGAARSGHYRVAKLLLARGADPKATSADGRTAWKVAEDAYRESNLHDARIVMQAIAEAGGGPAVAAQAPKVEAPTGPQVGSQVTHLKYGSGTILSIQADRWSIRFADGALKTLLAKFLTLG